MPKDKLKWFVPGATVINKGVIGIVDVGSEVEYCLKMVNKDGNGKVLSMCVVVGCACSTVISVGLSLYLGPGQFCIESKNN